MGWCRAQFLFTAYPFIALEAPNLALGDHRLERAGGHSGGLECELQPAPLHAFFIVANHGVHG